MTPLTNGWMCVPTLSRVSIAGYESVPRCESWRRPGHPDALLMPTRSCWLIPARGPASVPSPLPRPKLAGSLFRLGRSTLLNRAACQYPPGLVTCVLPWSRAMRTSGPLRCSLSRWGISSKPTHRVLSPETESVSSERRDKSLSSAALAAASEAYGPSSSASSRSMRARGAGAGATSSEESVRSGSPTRAASASAFFLAASSALCFSVCALRLADSSSMRLTSSARFCSSSSSLFAVRSAAALVSSVGGVFGAVAPLGSAGEEGSAFFAVFTPGVGFAFAGSGFAFGAGSGVLTTGFVALGGASSTSSTGTSSLRPASSSMASSASSSIPISSASSRRACRRSRSSASSRSSSYSPSDGSDCALDSCATASSSVSNRSSGSAANLHRMVATSYGRGDQCFRPPPPLLLLFWTLNGCEMAFLTSISSAGDLTKMPVGTSRNWLVIG